MLGEIILMKSPEKENKTNKKKKKNKSSRAKTVIAVIIVLAGLCVLFYPALGNVISYFQQMSVVAEYEQQVAEMTKSDISIQKELAAKYNESLGQITFQDPFSTEEETEPTEPEQTLDQYYTALSLNDEKMMGYIKIPEITVTCPIYHDATEAQLQKGIGHLKGTSLPIGGAGTHCVLTGHTGVPGNMLFTDLDKLGVGDKFYLHILDEVLAYQIDQIKVVEPNDTSELQVDRDKDYCTLVTCTPYGINSHRLLVRGVRTTYTPGEDDYESGTIITTDEDGNTVTKRVDGGSDRVNIFGLLIPKWVLWLLIPIAALLLLLIIVIIVRRRLRRKRMSEGKADENEKETENGEDKNNPLSPENDKDG